MTSNTLNNNLETIKLSDKEFNKLSNFIFSNYGIKMPQEKKIMLQSRLLKRLRALNISNFKEYIDFAFSKQEEAGEIIQLMDIVSTNKTDFFREPVHFEYITKNILPELNQDFYYHKTYKVWSAGSSSGEEAYTIAITLQEWANKNKWFKYTIDGSDISMAMLNKARSGTYKEERIDVIADVLKRKYFLRSKDRTKKMVRLVPELRSKTRFFRLNFMDEHYRIVEKFDMIFCRNTLIYFDNETQQKVLMKLCNQLRPGGVLFIGHSESIMNRELPLEQVKPTIYIRK